MKGHDLHEDSIAVRTEDTFATICWLLGIKPPKPIDGRPVVEILGTEHHAERR